MTDQIPDDALATITVSPPRRVMGYAVQLSLGVLLVYASLAGIAGFGASVVLFVFGALVLLGAERFRRASRRAIYLTAEGLFDTSGEVLAPFDQITGVSRGVFALKPSNGFAVITRDRQPRAWVPGLWWRMGRRVGVGGVTSAGAAKFMAEQIAMRLEGIEL